MKDRKTLFTDPNNGFFSIEYEGEVDKLLSEIPNSDYFKINDNIIAVSVPVNMIEYAISQFTTVANIDRGGIYTLSATTPIEAANTKPLQSNTSKFNGNGVLVGIIDTGIDYLNTEFIRADGSTKIFRLWDQSIQTGTLPKNMPFGSEYTEKDINSAISAFKAGEDPYAIVPSKDLSGHGTKMASLIAANGTSDLFSVVPSCSLAIVKLKPLLRSQLGVYAPYNTNIDLFTGVDIILGLKYLFHLAEEFFNPMVILVPFQCNIGSHKGTSNLERYIDFISNTRGLVVVTGTGNQGISGTHTSGTLDERSKTGDIELYVGEEQKNLLVDIWIQKPNRVSVTIIAPSGDNLNNVSPMFGTFSISSQFPVENTRVNVYFQFPENFTGDERISLLFTDITSGLWRINLSGSTPYVAEYDAYLEQSELLPPNTRFLNPTLEKTLTLPSTSDKVISVAFFNQESQSPDIKSGRGYTRDNKVKPDISAGGIDALVTTPGGKLESISGSSVAAAVVAGCCAMLLQWGIVEGFRPKLYSNNIKSILARGAKRRRSEIYPNNIWGYGEIDMLDTLKVKGVRLMVED